MLLSWSNISYSVETATQGSLRILKGVSGMARPSRMTAIMGASGSGKTTLLDSLCGRLKGGRFDGDILLNGAAVSSGQLKVSYVPQQDLLVRQRMSYRSSHVRRVWRDFNRIYIFDCIPS